MLGPVSPPEYKHYLLLDELYGTGDFDEARTLAEDVDRHLASSVESLARLYSREWLLVSDLTRLRFVLTHAMEDVSSYNLEAGGYIQHHCEPMIDGFVWGRE